MTKKARKYELPIFLAGVVSQATYERWLRRKAAAHVKRDRKRGNLTAGGEEYRVAIHAAVLSSRGRDCYTGEALQWNLISSYCNEKSQSGRRTYKAGFALLPTVDHIGDGTGAADFKICAWRTNDAKNDLSHFEFVRLCQRVVDHHHLGNTTEQAAAAMAQNKTQATEDLPSPSWGGVGGGGIMQERRQWFFLDAAQRLANP